MWVRVVHGPLWVRAVHRPLWVHGPLWETEMVGDRVHPWMGAWSLTVGE